MSLLTKSLFKEIKRVKDRNINILSYIYQVKGKCWKGQGYWGQILSVWK